MSEEVQNAAKPSGESSNSPEKKKYFSFDPGNFRFRLDIAAIVAIIAVVYQFASFAHKGYYSIEKQMYELKSSQEMLELKVKILEDQIEKSDDENEKMTDKLEDIENFVDKFEKKLDNENR